MPYKWPEDWDPRDGVEMTGNAMDGVLYAWLVRLMNRDHYEVAVSDEKLMCLTGLVPFELVRARDRMVKKQLFRYEISAEGIPFYSF